MIRVVLGLTAPDSEVLVGERRALFRLAVRVSLSGPTLKEHVATRPRPATVSKCKSTYLRHLMRWPPWNALHDGGTPALHTHEARHP